MSDELAHWLGLVLIIVSALALVWWPGAAMIRRLLASFDLGDTKSLPRPGLGRWIGRFERTLIVLLLIAGAPTAVGLVVTAKSILRFPEITGDKPRMKPEYVLVGSLASWTLAVAVGYIATLLIDQLPPA
ncbi:MAG: hypothetical protein QNJ75_04355 [Acidimicrobiia bacterium]|nr:hypothetical protein [Acidimicrobiia bacterium]